MNVSQSYGDGIEFRRPHKFLILNTMRSTSPGTPANTSFSNINDLVGLADEDGYLIALDSATIPHAVTPIHEFNKFLFVSEAGGPTLTATLTESSYTGAGFASEIETALNAMPGGTGVYTVTFSSETGLLTFTSTVSFTFVEVLSGVDAFDAYDEMGVDRYNFPSGTSFTASGPVHLSGTNSVILATNFSTNLFVPGTGIRNGLARIPMHASFGETQFFQNTLNTPMYVPARHLQQWEIQLRDEKGRIWPLPPTHHYELAFRIIPAPARAHMGIPQNRIEEYHPYPEKMQQSENKAYHSMYPVWEQ